MSFMVDIVDSESSYSNDEQSKQNSVIEKMKELIKNKGIVQQENPKAVLEYEAKELIEKLKVVFVIKYDINFLSDYCKVLETNDATTIANVTDKIMNSIEEMLRQLRDSDTELGEWSAVLLGAWLCAALLWRRPRVPAAPRALHALLQLAHDEHVDILACAWSRVGDAEALLALSDACTAPPASARLAHLLLRAAAARIAAAAPPAAAPPAPLAADELCALVGAVRGDAACLQLTRVAARVLAKRPSAELLQRLGLLTAERRDGTLLTSVERLRLLFEGSKRRNEDAGAPDKRRRRNSPPSDPST